MVLSGTQKRHGDRYFWKKWNGWSRGASCAHWLSLIIPSRGMGARRWEWNYRDGITDGLKQRRRSKPFEASASENYARADRGYSERMGYVSQFKQLYREAYCTGYQQGCYGEEEKIQSAKFAQVNQLG